LNLVLADNCEASSVVRETWQDPPSWLAVPRKVRCNDWPTEAEVTLATVNPAEVFLQGKLEPSAFRGEVSGSGSYGVGVFMEICALAIAEKRVVATVRTGKLAIMLKFIELVRYWKCFDEAESCS
jgi:hypothetical protein